MAGLLVRSDVFSHQSPLFWLLSQVPTHGAKPNAVEQKIEHCSAQAIAPAAADQVITSHQRKWIDHIVE